MKVGDLVHDRLTGMRGIIVENRGIIVENQGPEDSWLVLHEDGVTYECGDWELEVISEGR